MWGQFDEPSLGLSREFLLQGLGNDVVRAYFEYMVDMAEMFGADPAEAREELTEVLEFETNLANVCLHCKFGPFSHKAFNLNQNPKQ